MESYRILEIATKKAKTGNEYWVVKTDKGTFATFDTEQYKQIESALSSNRLIELELVKQGNFNNLKTVGELKEQMKPLEKGSGYQSGDRILVDTGNILQRATDLTIAVIQNSKEPVQAPKVLTESCKVCLEQFKWIRSQLENPGQEA